MQLGGQVACVGLLNFYGLGIRRKTSQPLYCDNATHNHSQTQCMHAYTEMIREYMIIIIIIIVHN